MKYKVFEPCPTKIGGTSSKSNSSFSFCTMSNRGFAASLFRISLLTLVLMVLGSLPSFSQKPDISSSVVLSQTSDVYIGCTSVCIEYTVYNAGEVPAENVDLGLFVNTTFVEVLDPGSFVLNVQDSAFYCSTCSPPTNNVSDFYNITNLTIPSDTIIVFNLCFKFISGVPNSPLFHETMCINGNCNPIQEIVPVINPISTEVLADVGDTVNLSQLINPITLQPLAPGSTTKRVIVRGTLVIDTTYEFMERDFMLDNANASIIVQAPNTLKLTNEHLYGCKEAWKGITVESGATIKIGVNGVATSPPSIFEDAEVGITALDGSTVNVTNTQFLNNRKGIRVPPASTNNVVFIVGNNHFEVTQLKAPLVGNGFAGLDLNRVSVAVLSSNTYKSMDYGIYGASTNLFTAYDEFTDLNIAGIAMTGSGHLLYEYGKGNSLAAPTFSTMPTAIRTYGMNVFLTSNGMTNVDAGVRALSLNNRDAFIFDNSIAATKNGILVTSMRPLNYSAIDDNNIVINGNVDGRGINSISSNIGTASYLRINDNVVNVFNATYGVDMVNNRGVQAQGNHVNLNNSQAGFGIAVGGGNNNHLLGNYLDATSLVNEQYGISVGQSMQGEYGCNHFDGTRTGLWFTGPNASSDIAGNDFDGFLFGIQVGNGGAPGSPNLGGYTGVQSHRGNMWNSTPTATGFGAIHYTEDVFELNGSLLEVDPNDGSNLISTQKTFVANHNYFDPISGTTYTCPDYLTEGNPEIYLGGVEQGIASDSLTVGTFAAENWTAKRQLYRQLKANPSLAPQGSVFEAYLSNEANSTVGKFEDIQVSIDAMLAGDSSSRSQLASYVSNLATKFGEAKVIEDSLITQPNSTTLLAQRSAKQAEIATLAGQVQSVEQSMLASRISVATQLLTTNAAISTSATHEANQKTANRILLETIANDQTDLTAQQVTDLTPIAVQCPYEGGEGVYAARALLGNEVAYDDYEACDMGEGGQAIKMPADHGGTALTSFTSYPNPANGYVMVQLDKKLDGDASLTLTNALGAQVMAESLAEGTEAVPLFIDKLPAGTYFLTLKSSAGKKSSVLVISR
ncbi:MAG: T9SS type A sorting domain-containing protein [Bacteroidetes bacterium]|nr:T9SS type A sorting domain-containing protein [Bacteroidota bacterium]